jgi:membrane protein implicated in regulation of membrane protease activity
VIARPGSVLWFLALAGCTAGVALLVYVVCWLAAAPWFLAADCLDVMLGYRSAGDVERERGKRDA